MIGALRKRKRNKMKKSLQERWELFYVYIQFANEGITVVPSNDSVRCRDDFETLTPRNWVPTPGQLHASRALKCYASLPVARCPWMYQEKESQEERGETERETAVRILSSSSPCRVWKDSRKVSGHRFSGLRRMCTGTWDQMVGAGLLVLDIYLNFCSFRWFEVPV